MPHPVYEVYYHYILTINLTSYSSFIVSSTFPLFRQIPEVWLRRLRLHLRVRVLHEPQQRQREGLPHTLGAALAPYIHFRSD